VTIDTSASPPVVFLTGFQIDALTPRGVDDRGELPVELLSPGGRPPAAH
jgi:hypothetical protein